MLRLTRIANIHFPSYYSCSNAHANQSRNLYSSSKDNGLFHEFDRKSGYHKEDKRPAKEKVREGLSELKGEIKIWSNEWKDRFMMDPILGMPLPGEVDAQWTFNPETDFSEWVVTSDKDNNEGYSTCSLTVSPTGKGLFSGNLSTQLIKDGKVKRTGYCNMRSIQPARSFKRETYHDWTSYTHLVLRIRGDGRSYMLNIGSAGYFDITWNDMYNYMLFTRGGPHWQITRIPFSKFFLTSKGRIQDKQSPLPLNRVSNFGITVGDKNNGPFRLEIDYIGLECDPSHTEVTAYETYRVPAFYAGY